MSRGRILAQILLSVRSSSDSSSLWFLRWAAEASTSWQPFLMPTTCLSHYSLGIPKEKKKGEFGNRDSQGEYHVYKEMFSKAKEHQRLPVDLQKLGQGPGTNCLSQASEGINSVDIEILDFEPPDSGTIHFSCSKTVCGALLQQP